MANEIPVNWVAWYAAIVATGTMLVHLFNFRRDRARLHVVAKADMLTTATGDEPHVVVEVRNVGRRTVHLSGLPYFTIRGEKTAGIVITDAWKPTSELGEGQVAMVLCKQTGLDFDTLKNVVVRDQAGRLWKGPIRRTK